MNTFFKSKLFYTAIAIRVFIYFFLLPYANNVKQLPFLCSRMTNFEEFKEAKYFIDHN